MKINLFRISFKGELLYKSVWSQIQTNLMSNEYDNAISDEKRGVSIP